MDPEGSVHGVPGTLGKKKNRMFSLVERGEEAGAFLNSGPSRWFKSVIADSGGSLTRYFFFVCPLSVLMFCIIVLCQWAFFGHGSHANPLADQSFFQSICIHISTVFFTSFSACVLMAINSQSKQRSCAVVSATISLVAGVAHLVMGLGMSPISASKDNIHAVVHLRWAEWMVCVPLMTFIVCDFVQAKYLFACMGTQFLVVVLGYISEIVVIRWLKLVCFLTACLLYVFSMLSIYVICRALDNCCGMAKKSELVHVFELSQHSVQILCKSIVLIWTIFPLVFSLKMFGYISEQDYIDMSPILDLSAKAVFLGLLLTVHSHSDHKKNNQLVKELKRQNSFQAKFLRFVYHEIRNPFNTIMLGLDHLLNEIQIQEHCQLLITLKKCARSVNKVIDDAVELTKNQASLELLLEPTCLEQLVYDAVGEFSVQAEVKKVRIETHISKNVPMYVLADYVKMKKLFETLISNGVKFSSSGGIVTVALVVEEILQLNKVSCNFSVLDHGPGISDEILPFLFEPFGLVRPGDFSEDEDRGSGLGLCMAKHLADLMNAQVSVTTKLGNGSHFNVSFTLETCPQLDPNSKTSKSFFSKQFTHRWSFNDFYSSKNKSGRRNALSSTKIQLRSKITPEEKGCSGQIGQSIPSKASQVDRFASSLSSAVLGSSSSQFMNSNQSASFGTKRLRSITHNFKLSSHNEKVAQSDFEPLSPTTGIQKKRTSNFFGSLRASIYESSPNGSFRAENEAYQGRAFFGASEKVQHRIEKVQEIFERKISVSRHRDVSWPSETISEIKGSIQGDKEWLYQHPDVKEDAQKQRIALRRQAFVQAQAMPRPVNFGIAFRKANDRQGYGAALNTARSSRQMALSSFNTDSPPETFREESFVLSDETKRPKESDSHGSSVQESANKMQMNLETGSGRRSKHTSSDSSSKCSKHILLHRTSGSSNACSKEAARERTESGTPPRRSIRSRDSGRRGSVQVHSQPHPKRKSVSQPPLSSRSKEPHFNSAASMSCSPRAKTILIVDDVKSNARLADMILTKAGFHCSIANNGQEAVELALLQHFDLILMDNVMPIMNGIEATRRILALKPGSTIVGVTGNVLQSDQDEFLQAGAKQILQKPVDRIQLLKACNTHCKCNMKN